MVESTALEMRHTGNCIVGSTPTLSANALKITPSRLRRSLVILDLARKEKAKTKFFAFSLHCYINCLGFDLVDE